VTLVVTSIACQTFIFAGLSLPITQSILITRVTIGVVRGYTIAGFDRPFTILNRIFVLFLVLSTLPLPATGL
jgi:hypothetical protein